MINQQISSGELAAVRSLNDFDLTMLLSDIHDHGWAVAKETLQLILVAGEKGRADG